MFIGPPQTYSATAGLATWAGCSNEKTPPQLQILNWSEPYENVGGAIAIASLRKTPPTTIFSLFRRSKISIHLQKRTSCSWPPKIPSFKRSLSDQAFTNTPWSPISASYKRAVFWLTTLPISNKKQLYKWNLIWLPFVLKTPCQSFTLIQEH